MDNLDLNLKPLNPPPSGGPSWFRKPWFLALIAVGILLVAGFFSIDRVMNKVLHSKPEVAVPNLEGKSLTDSLNLVSGLGLSLKQDGTEFDDTLPAGTIVRQHPPVGMNVRVGRAIQVVVSKGGQAVFVPNVIGRPVAEAQSLFQNERLQLGSVSSLYSLDVGEGLVIDQDPSSGTVVSRGALVDVDVSKGLPPAGIPTVPDFHGQSVDQAKEWASGVNAIVKVVEDAKAMGLAGTVARQSPLAGQPLMEGDALKLTIVPLAASDSNKFQYQVPSGRGEVNVRLMARDNRGESEIYSGFHKGGDMITLPMSVTTPTRVRIYLDESLADEKVVEP